jgi:hypothetical protein
LYLRRISEPSARTAEAREDLDAASADVAVICTMLKAILVGYLRWAWTMYSSRVRPTAWLRRGAETGVEPEALDALGDLTNLLGGVLAHVLGSGFSRSIGKYAIDNELLLARSVDCLLP